MIILAQASLLPDPSSTVATALSSAMGIIQPFSLAAASIGMLFFYIKGLR
jgi:hypothetical protein